MHQDEIVKRVLSAYPEAAIDILGADCNFELHVVSDGFAGQSLLQRQKGLLGLFKDELQSGELHELTIKAKTPEEAAQSR